MKSYLDNKPKKEFKPEKQFKTSYWYKEPVFNPEKIPWINAMMIKWRIWIDNW